MCHSRGHVDNQQQSRMLRYNPVQSYMVQLYKGEKNILRKKEVQMRVEISPNNLLVKQNTKAYTIQIKFKKTSNLFLFPLVPDQ